LSSVKRGRGVGTGVERREGGERERREISGGEEDKAWSWVGEEDKAISGVGPTGP
jgi:hypothetical protein